jgi:hypothetical protein
MSNIDNTINYYEPSYKTKQTTSTGPFIHNKPPIGSVGIEPTHAPGYLPLQEHLYNRTKFVI